MNLWYSGLCFVMGIIISAPHPLHGAQERLKRADENIKNLNREIIDFLAPAPVLTLAVDVDAEKPIITDEDRATFEKLKEFILSARIDPRLKVLAGEIIHHLRCAFDHVAWQLSSADLQANSPTQIEFPVFKDRPETCRVAKKKICRYCRKVEGISSPTALARIDRLQPYHRSDPTRDPLWLIHDMDRIDKHRELIVVVCGAQMNLNAIAQLPAIGRLMPWEIRPSAVRITDLPTNVEMKAKMTAQVTFNELSKRDDQPIIPTLQNLLSFASDAVKSFAGEF